MLQAHAIESHLVHGFAQPSRLPPHSEARRVGRHAEDGRPLIGSGDGQQFIGCCCVGHERFRAAQDETAVRHLSRELHVGRFPSVILRLRERDDGQTFAGCGAAQKVVAIAESTQQEAGERARKEWTGDCALPQRFENDAVVHQRGRSPAMRFGDGHAR